jgi:hypothetical protein
LLPGQKQESRLLYGRFIVHNPSYTVRQAAPIWEGLRGENIMQIQTAQAELRRIFLGGVVGQASPDHLVPRHKEIVIFVVRRQRTTPNLNVGPHVRESQSFQQPRPRHERAMAPP